MKIKFIAAAVAAVCAQSSFADAGFTAAQAKIAQAVASGNVLKLSGASAMAGSIRSAFAKTCAGNKIDAWFINPASITSGTGNFNLYVCTGKDLATTNYPASPFFANSADHAQVLIVSHAGSASSLQGAVGADVALLQTSLAGCNTTSVANQTVQGVVVPVYGSCTTATTGANAKSIGGFSDVERDLFASVVTAGGLLGVDDNNIGNVETTASFGGQAFSIVVSRPLYRALQAAQGISSADCLNDTVTLNAAGTAVTAVTTVGSNDFTTPACQPSITKQQYASLIASSNAESIGAATNPWATVGLPAQTPKRNLRLARRDDLSGTQASSNAYFLNLNCASGPHGGGIDPTAATSGSLVVSLNSGTGAVLTAVNSGELSANKGTANDYVIGVVSSENLLRTAGTFDSFGFLKLNGVSPTEDAKQRQSAIDGRYDFAMEFVLHTNSNDAGVPKDFAKLLNDLIGGDPSDVDSPDLAGVFALPLGGLSNAAFPTRVAKGTKGGNNCSPALNTF